MTYNVSITLISYFNMHFNYGLIRNTKKYNKYLLTTRICFLSLSKLFEIEKAILSHTLLRLGYSFKDKKTWCPSLNVTLIFWEVQKEKGVFHCGVSWVGQVAWCAASRRCCFSLSLFISSADRCPEGALPASRLLYAGRVCAHMVTCSPCGPDAHDPPDTWSQGH